MGNAAEVLIVLLLVLTAIGLCTVAVTRAVQIAEDSRRAAEREADR